MSVIQLDLSKNKKIQITKINYINIDRNVELKIINLNGKTKKYCLINKNKTKLSFKFRHRNIVILQTIPRKKLIYLIYIILMIKSRMSKILSDFVEIQFHSILHLILIN